MRHDGHVTHRPRPEPAPQRSSPNGTSPDRPPAGDTGADAEALRLRADRVLELVLDLERDLLHRPSAGVERIDAITAAVCDLDDEIASAAHDPGGPRGAVELQGARRSLADAHVLAGQLLLRLQAA